MFDSKRSGRPCADNHSVVSAERLRGLTRVQGGWTQASPRLLAPFQESEFRKILVSSLEPLDVRYQVPDVTVKQDTIQISAGAALIETESARISDTKEREVMRNLRLSLRRVWDFVTMTPMVDNNNWHQIPLPGGRAYRY